jgi:hypothetical protein
MDLKLKYILNELLDVGDSYPFQHSFRTELVDEEDEETGETYKKEVLSPVQIIKFKTPTGLEYMWYARQGNYDDTSWSIAFGVYKGKDEIRGSEKIDIKKTGTGDAFRVLSTVLNIINTFVEFDENYEIRRLTFESEGKNRTDLYLKRLVPKIENFEVENVHTDGESSVVTLRRTL